MKNFKKILCMTLCVLMVAVFAGCGAKNSSSTGVNIVEKLNSLMVSDQTLGISGKYTKLADIKEGSVDKELVGTWLTADGATSYTYGEDGIIKAKSEYGDNELPFTCMTIDGYRIICEEHELSPEFYDGAKEGDTQLSYTAYSVENDALYQVIVEQVNEDYNQNISALVIMYHADESGSASEAVKKNPIDLNALNGTWKCDNGSFTVSNGTLTLGDDSFTLSLDENNKLVVSKDGESTTYGMAISCMKEYDYEDRTKFTESVAMGISFTGSDENDKPNLLPVLVDYKTEFDYDTWYYSGSFTLLKDGESAQDEDFEEIEENGEETEETANLFQKGVWSASIDGKIDTYFVFYDEFSGRTERADGTGGVGFTCEQNGWDIVFHFGSADDVTNATFSEGDNTGTFDYGDRTVTYTFELVPDADAHAFEVPAQ
ncbi:MAG: hypothetical protein K6B52_02825 [Clostridiales bacterium]|nr:hypothetical protein [Clostridiales bacterium]